MRVLHTIHLHGKLAEFGESFKLAVTSPADAARALCVQIPGFSEVFRKGAYRLVKGKDPNNGVEFDEAALTFPIGATSSDFHFIPVVEGAKSGGIGKIVLGAAIIAASVIGATITGGGSFTIGMALSDLGAGAFGISALTYGGVMAFGGALMLAGVASMLQPSMKMNYDNNSADQKASFFLGGQVNQAMQGGPVVLAYGHCRVGSTVVSAGLNSERM